MQIDSFVFDFSLTGLQIDAGTFNKKSEGEGGANGCLLNNVDMQAKGENDGLENPVGIVFEARNLWENHPKTCIKISAADMIQFAGFYGSVRQTGISGLTEDKKNQLKTFEWGRVDLPESDCQPAWTENLPGFKLENEKEAVPKRCRDAGIEIKKKMMNRNGFSAREAVALIGAHTIGLTRKVFSDFHAGPWVVNGADDATPQGPIFDNEYFKFLKNDIQANTVEEFAFDFPNNIQPFDVPFNDWFKDTARNLNHLDTDVGMLIASDGVHCFHQC